jgi:hypothetical protein
VEHSPQSLNSLPLTRSSTTSTPTCCSATPNAQFQTPELHFLAAVLLHSGRARHARGRHQLTPAPINTYTSFPVTCSCSTTNHSPPISIGTSSPTERRRRRLRPHRGQLEPSPSTPTQHRSQHHIITLKLPDPFIGSLVHHRASPTLAGVLPRRRRLGLCRLPLIQITLDPVSILQIDCTYTILVTH